MSSRAQIVKLYQDLAHESSKFKSYYYKNYFLRKTENLRLKHIDADPETSAKLFDKSQAMLDMVRRTCMIANAYGDTKLVIEDKQVKERADDKSKCDVNKNDVV